MNPFEIFNAAGRVATAALDGDTVIVRGDTAAARLEVCAGCPVASVIAGTGNALWCDIRKGGCGCILSVKARLATERCPLGKW